MGSLNKIPLSIAGIVLFHVPTSLQNSASILFGKHSLCSIVKYLLRCINLREACLVYRSCGWSCVCQSQNEGEVLETVCHFQHFFLQELEYWTYSKRLSFPNSIVCGVELGLQPHNYSENMCFLLRVAMK